MKHTPFYQIKKQRNSTMKVVVLPGSKNNSIKEKTKDHHLNHRKPTRGGHHLNKNNIILLMEIDLNRTPIIFTIHMKIYRKRRGKIWKITFFRRWKPCWSLEWCLVRSMLLFTDNHLIHLQSIQGIKNTIPQAKIKISGKRLVIK